jgi:hypothetical protein
VKLEVIDSFKKELIATYVVPELSMLSFQKWKDRSQVVASLSQLSDVVENLSSVDPVTEMPICLGR